MLELEQDLRERAAEHRNDRGYSQQCLRKLRRHFPLLHVIRQAHKERARRHTLRARRRILRNKQPPWNGKPAEANSLPHARCVLLLSQPHARQISRRCLWGARVSDCRTHVLLFKTPASLTSLVRPSRRFVACSVPADIPLDSVLFPWKCTHTANQLSLARSPGFARCRTSNLSGARYWPCSNLRSGTSIQGILTL